MDPPNVRDRRLNSASEYIRVFSTVIISGQAAPRTGHKSRFKKNSLRTLTLGEDSMTDIKKDKPLSEKSETKVAGPDAGRRRIIKGAGAVTAAGEQLSGPRPPPTHQDEVVRDASRYALA